MFDFPCIIAVPLLTVSSFPIYAQIINPSKLIQRKHSNPVINRGGLFPITPHYLLIDQRNKSYSY